MNSSGIKRGLAASAIGALAVTGVPALANTASAAVGDNFTVVSTGPALNGGTEGAVVVIRAENGEINPALLDAVGTNGTTSGSEDNADQNVEVVSAASQGANSGGTGFELIEVRVAVTTSNTGDTATFRLFEDDSPNDGDLDASEARQTVSIQTAGPLASIDVSPATQSTPQGIESGDYTVTLKDAAGRTTQLAPGTVLSVDDEAPVEATDVAADDQITSDEIADGTATFEGNPNGATPGEYDIRVFQAAISDTATLVVTEAANLSAGEIDIVTAADSYNGFGDGTNGGTTLVRVDQNTIRFDFNSDPNQPGAHVRLAVDGTGVTFAGQDQAVFSTTLDQSGNGSITVTVDAATIQDADTFAVDINGFTQTIEFDRATPTTIDGAQAVYFCQDDAACTVTAVVRDQFGNPVTTGEVAARRTGAQNVDTTAQRKPVGADGTVEFTFTDANPVDGGSDTVRFDYFVDQFDQTADLTDTSTEIRYSATGQGSDFVVSLDGENTEGANYKPADAAVIPLFDAVADTTTGTNDEDAEITITGAENNQAVTLSVDNGALILAPGETNLSQGSSSVETTTSGTGTLPAGYRIVGTKSGLVTLTVSSANRTETAQLTVKAQDNVNSARNVTVSGPETVENGTTQIPFVAVVTDAFGNPVQGVAVTDLNIQVTGPAQFQDSDVVTNANGQLTLNVRVDSDAEGAVTIKVTGIPGRYQFGAAENRLDADGTPTAPGLPASSNVATATTTVEPADEPEPEPEPTQEPISPGLRLLNAQDRETLFGYNLIQVRAPKADGARVDIFRVKDGAPARRIKSKTLNNRGFAQFKRADLNGSKVTRYYAVVRATEDTLQGRTKTKGIR